MTKQQLDRKVRLIIAFYTLLLIVGILLRIFDKTCDLKYYSTYKDLVPFLFAVPAAFLAHFLHQRRLFTDSLKLLWSNMIRAVNGARIYTHNEKPSASEYSNVLRELSQVIDEIRGVYLNFPRENYPKGVYPFSPIKRIHKLISDLGYSSYNQSESEATRSKIDDYWQMLQESFLEEFKTTYPTYYSASKMPKSKFNNWRKIE